MSREYGKDHGLFGASQDMAILADWTKEAQVRREKHLAHYKNLMQKDGIVSDESEIHRTAHCNGTLGSRCKERIVRAQQRRALDQIKGIEVDTFSV